ncbi:hypothetical protein SESBI_06744 [Sesbania bispinosa]|nr:hypothetical protein SESBI_06744 [Sesbania bispinosa]
MVAQSVVVIQDASSREINSRIFHWAPQGLSLKEGDMITLVAVLHQVITPLGYKISVDSRLTFGADQKIIDAQVARKKEEYLKNEELAQIYKMYKSMKVGFNIEIAMGSSPKAVALKSATKLKATWVILDRKMKNDEEYFLQKLSCGISRIRRYNKIVRLRGPRNLPQQTRRESQDNSSEIYADSIPLQDISTELDLFSIEISPKSHISNYQMDQKQGQRQKSPHDETGCSALDSDQTGDINPNQLSTDVKDIDSNQLQCQIERDQQCQDEIQETRHQGKKRDPKLQQELKENNSNITCGGSNRKTQEHESLSTENFPSKKSLHGHMRSHPERRWRGVHPPYQNQNSSNCSMEENNDGSSKGLLKYLPPSWGKTDKRGRGCIYSDEDINAAQILMFMSRDNKNVMNRELLSQHANGLNDENGGDCHRKNEEKTMDAEIMHSGLHDQDQHVGMMNEKNNHTKVGGETEEYIHMLRISLCTYEKTMTYSGEASQLIS